MYQLAGYSDSDNIIIDPNSNRAYFHYTGTSYRDRLKNGLLLEKVYEQEESYVLEAESIVVNAKTQPLQSSKPCKYDDSINLTHIYDQDEYKKRKNRSKKHIKKNMNKKKHKIRQNGYSDKLFVLEQNLPKEYDEKEDSYYYIENDIYYQHNSLRLVCFCCSCLVEYCSDWEL